MEQRDIETPRQGGGRRGLRPRSNGALHHNGAIQMIRRIIQIDEEKCNGCGLCVDACHEGAIGLVNGKARLLRDDYCDGLGDCLPTCPTEAISFVEREALPYDEAAVEANMRQKKTQGGGCPGSAARKLGERQGSPCPSSSGPTPSQLRQWPVQLKLAPATAPFFAGADLLLAADCAAFAHGDFHNRFMQGKVTLIGCPKLDNADYSEKLADILSHNDIRSITAVRMSVPCCAGIAAAAQKAIEKAGKAIPLETVVITPEGEIAPQNLIPGQPRAPLFPDNGL